MAKSSIYSFKNVAATLDGLPVQGAWDGDDAIVVARGVEIGTGLIGADGSSIFSQTMDASAQITIRLQHTSPTHRRLLQKEARQRANPQGSGFPFDFVDTGSGEGGSTDQCFIMNAPDDSKGKNAVVREWVLWTGQWNPLIPAE